MILWSIVLLFSNYFFIYLNIRQLSYNGVFFLTLLSLFFSFNFLSWSLYKTWINQYTLDVKPLTWIDLSNNIYVYWDIKENFFNNLVAFVMIFGALSVSFFVYFEMYYDKEGHNFIVILGFFIIFMLILIGSNNLIFFYLGWEGIALVSYFLVNFWSERVRSIKAVIKIFIISKIGDFFIIIFISFIIIFFGSVDFDSINSISFLLINNKIVFGFLKFHLNEILGLFLLFGTCIKSAQYGFHIWLLEAMEAPLGASALMHSSTLVISGVILILKLSIIIELSVYSQLFMYIMGIFSALMGSFIACFQFELKMILAYSTISNMGYIFILLSVGAYYESTVVILLHAFIKIYMFLIVGNIIYNNNGCQDIRWIGNSFKYSKFLWVNYIIGGLCLIGLPYFSGYYYKNYLLNSLINNFLYLRGGEFILLFSYFFTIFYVFRIGYIVFLSSKAGHKNVYKIKKFSLFFITSFIFLSTYIYLFHFFWINLIYLNILNLIDSKIFSSIRINSFFFFDLTYLSSYLWVIIYVYIFIVLYVAFYLTLTKEWYCLSYTNYLHIFFTIFLLFYLVKCIVINYIFFYIN